MSFSCTAPQMMVREHEYYGQDLAGSKPGKCVLSRMGPRWRRGATWSACRRAVSRPRFSMSTWSALFQQRRQMHPKELGRITAGRRKWQPRLTARAGTEHSAGPAMECLRACSIEKVQSTTVRLVDAIGQTGDTSKRGAGAEGDSGIGRGGDARHSRGWRDGCFRTEARRIRRRRTTHQKNRQHELRLAQSVSATPLPDHDCATLGADGRELDSGSSPLLRVCVIDAISSDMLEA
jgi:hypothetical protein